MKPEQHLDVEAALLAYWTSRDEAAIAQRARGSIDVGGRAGVTSGGHLDRVAQLLAKVCVRAGARADQVWYRAPKGDPLRRAGAATGYTLPGFFRPTKQWDLVVANEDGPIVAVELKSQNGPSYGNNANNRAEEAIGNALDLKLAEREGLLPRSPWTGFVFIIEDDDDSRESRGARDTTHYSRDPEFQQWTYVDRVRILSERLVTESMYDSTWAVATARPPNFSWRELGAPKTGYVQFVDSMAREVAAKMQPR